MKLDFGVKIREYYMVVGYFGKWLVAQNEDGEYYISEEPFHLYDIGTFCDSDMRLAPARCMPEKEYRDFEKEYMAEV